MGSRVMKVKEKTCTVLGAGTERRDFSAQVRPPAGAGAGPGESRMPARTKSAAHRLSPGTVQQHSASGWTHPSLRRDSCPGRTRG